MIHLRFRNSNIVFKKILNGEVAGVDYEVATYGGIARKSIFYLLLVLAGAFGGLLLARVNPDMYAILLSVSIFSTFIFALISFLSPSAVKVTGSIYCLLEGLFVGFLSAVYGAVADGAVVTALLSTIMVFMVVTTLFLTNIVRVKSGFIKFLVIFAIGLFLTQIILYLIMTFTGQAYNFGLCLGISVLTVFLATLYLFFDLEHIRQVVEGGYPKDLEWYASFGLVFTLVWLYIEILRIVTILFANRD